MEVQLLSLPDISHINLKICESVKQDSISLDNGKGARIHKL